MRSSSLVSSQLASLTRCEGHSYTRSDGSYSEIVLEHAKNPRNVGIIEDADARGVQMNPVCGDTLMLTLRIADGRIAESRIQTQGLRGLCRHQQHPHRADRGHDAGRGDGAEPRGCLGGGRRPASSKLHSAALVIDALRRAVKGYQEAHVPRRGSAASRCRSVSSRLRGRGRPRPDRRRAACRRCRAAGASPPALPWPCGGAGPT